MGIDKRISLPSLERLINYFGDNNLFKSNDFSGLCLLIGLSDYKLLSYTPLYKAYHYMIEDNFYFIENDIIVIDGADDIESFNFIKDKVYIYRTKSGELRLIEYGIDLLSINECIVGDTRYIKSCSWFSDEIFSVTYMDGSERLIVKGEDIFKSKMFKCYVPFNIIWYHEDTFSFDYCNNESKSRKVLVQRGEIIIDRNDIIGVDWSCDGIYKLYFEDDLTAYYSNDKLCFLKRKANELDKEWEK